MLEIINFNLFKNIILYVYSIKLMFEYFFLSSKAEVKSPTIKEDSNGFLVIDNKEKSNAQNKEINNKLTQSTWTRNSEGRLVRVN
jgi:hypothetical protein